MYITRPIHHKYPYNATQLKFN